MRIANLANWKILTPLLFGSILVGIILFGFKHVIAPNSSLVFTEDAEQWYAMFHLMAVSVKNNFIPLWIPYIDLGVPALPALSLWCLYDPLSVVLIKVLGVIFPSNFQAYHIFFLLRMAFVTTGVLYLHAIFFKRNLSGRKPSRLVLSFFVLIEVVTIGAFFRIFLMDAYYTTLQYLPWAMAFYFKWLWQGKTSHLLATVLFIGLFVGTASYSCIIGGTAFFIIVLSTAKYASALKIKVWNVKFLLSCVCVLALLASLILPVLENYRQSKTLYPIGRTQNNRVLFESGETKVISYDYQDMIRGGSSIPLAPLLHQLFRALPDPWHTLRRSEPLPYQILAVILCVVFAILTGIGLLTIFNRANLFLLTAGAFLIFMVLGPYTPIHKALTYIIPPLRIVRNTNFYAVHIWVLLGIVMINGLLKVDKIVRHPRILIALNVLLIGVLVILDVNPQSFKPFLKTVEQYKPTFFDKRQSTFTLPVRELFAPRPPWYLFDPILTQNNIVISTLPLPPAQFATKKEDYPLFKEWGNYHADYASTPSFGLRTFFWTQQYYFLFRQYELDPQKLKDRLQMERPLVEVYTLADCSTAPYFDCQNAPGKPVQPENIHFTPNQVTFDTDNQNPGLAVYRDSFYPGWEAEVNGSVLPVTKFTGIFKAVILPPGNNNVKFIYRPTFLTITLTMQYSAALFLIILIFYYKRQEAP